MFQLKFNLKIFKFRLILVTILIVHKYYTDQFFFNSYVASLGGMLTKEINFLEQEFLEMIDFNLSVSTEEFVSFNESISEFFSCPLKDEIIEIKASMDNYL